VFPDLLSELTLEIFCLPFFLIRAIEIRKVKQVVARVEFVAACILSVYGQCVELRVVEEYKSFGGIVDSLPSRQRSFSLRSS